MVATHDFYLMDPAIWVPIIAFSRVVVKWNVIFFNLLFFSYETLKMSKVGDWNELIENENFAEFTDSGFW